MRKILDYFSWGFLLVFLIPSVLIVASWNALPGDRAYGVKLALESTLLFVARPSYAADGALNVKYTERRFSETKRLLADRQSVEGLPYLERQVAATKAVIDRAPSVQAKRELAKVYLATLKDVAGQLEQQKVALAAAAPAGRPVAARRTRPSSSRQPVSSFSQPSSEQEQPPPSAPFFVPQIFAPSSPTPTPIPQENNEVVFPTPTPPGAESPAEPSGDIVSEIDDTQKNIEDTIEDLEKITQNDESKKDNKDKEKNNDQNNSEEHANNGGGNNNGQGQGSGN